MAPLLFIIAGFTLYGSIASSSKGNASLSATLLVVTCIIVFYGFLFYRDQKLGKEFKDWLLLNADNIRQHGDFFNGIPVDDQTEFMQFEICFSWVIISHRFKSSYYVNGYHPTPLLNVLFCLFTCFFGLFAFPMGPINTFQVLSRNIMARPKRLNKVIQELKHSTT